MKELLHQMRRVLASLLLAILSFPLMAPAFAADSASQLPPCCRRDGAHRCAMLAGAMPGDMEAQGRSFQSIRPKCPFYPATTVSPTEGRCALPRNSKRIFASIVCSHAVPVSTESRYRVSFGRSRQKRGPPLFS